MVLSARFFAVIAVIHSLPVFVIMSLITHMAPFEDRLEGATECAG